MFDLLFILCKFGAQYIHRPHNHLLNNISWTNRLETLEIANEKLSGLNALSEGNFQRMSQEFRQNTQTLAGVKRELDSVFRRIR